MPPQITRLVLVAVVVMASYAVMRSSLRPPSFGQYGHFRGAALTELANHQVSYAGRKACSECHDDLEALLGKSPHRSLSCEVCHGPLKAHVDNPDLQPVKRGDSLCLRCHASNPARPAFQKQIVRSGHYADSSCLDCHLPHQPDKSPE